MKRKIRYFVLDHEKEFREQFWRKHGLKDKLVIGVNLRSAETYRDYPHMKKLARFLSRNMKLLLFQDEAISDYNWENVIKVDDYPLRSVFALAGKCDAIVAPDSAFLHLADALDIPCIALFGPTDGTVRTRCYSRTRYLDAKSKLGCVPCWRNEDIPCKLTRTRKSACMGLISVREIYRALGTTIKAKKGF